MWMVVCSRVWDETEGVWKWWGGDGKLVDVIPQHEAAHSKEGEEEEEEVIRAGEQDVLNYVYCRLCTLKLNTSCWSLRTI